MSTSSIQTPVRISVPASVAYNLDSFHKVVGNLAESLGCTRCLSGANCIFSLHTDYVVDPEKFTVNPVERFGPV